jgi:hypothetical protein
MSADDKIDRRLEEFYRTVSDGREALRSIKSLQQGGGGGTSGGMSDDWKSSVDAQLGQLHADARNLLLGLIGGFLFLLSAGAAAYVALSDKISDAQVEQVEIKGDIKLVNQKLDTLLERSKKD